MSMRQISIIAAVLLLASACDWVDAASVSSGGALGNGPSTAPATSDDGQIVAYASQATNLVANDTSANSDVFVHDHATGATTRVSQAPDGSEADSGSWDAHLSDDGRYVLFRSLATNLVVGDTNGVADIFRHDRQTGTTELVSLATGGGQGNRNADAPAINGDGSVVAWMSGADNLVAGDTNNAIDIFVRDLAAGTTERVSLNVVGDEIGDDSIHPSLDDSGDLVAFATVAGLVFGDSNGAADVYVTNRAAGTLLLPTSGGVSLDDGDRPVLSGDGTRLAWVTDVGHFEMDVNGVNDVYFAELVAPFIRIPATFVVGAANTAASGAPSISDDGHEIGFRSDEAKLPIDTDTRADLYATILDPAAPGGVLPSVLLIDMDRGADTEGDDNVGGGHISGDGRFFAWSTASSNIIPGDTNGWPDIVSRSIATPADLDPDIANPSVPPGGSVVLVFSGTAIDPGANVWISPGTDLTINAVAVMGHDEVYVTVTADPSAQPGPRSLVVENESAAWSSQAWSGDICIDCLTIAP